MSISQDGAIRIHNKAAAAGSHRQAHPSLRSRERGCGAVGRGWAPGQPAGAGPAAAVLPPHAAAALVSTVAAATNGSSRWGQQMGSRAPAQ